MAREERAQEERRQIKSNVKDLTKNIRNTQGAINSLKGAIGRLDRIDESIKVQLRGINEDIHFMKEEISALKESVSLMGAVPVSDQEESSGAWIESEENVEILEGIIRGVVDKELSKGGSVVAAEPPTPTDADLPPLEDESMIGEEEEEASFFEQYGIFALIAIGLLLVIGAVLYYLKMNAGEDEDEDEDNNDDDLDDDLDDEEDDEEEDFEIEEEDDIVVQETA